MSAASWLRRNVMYPLWVAKDRSPRLRYMRELEQSQYFPIARLRELQMRKLREVIAHAYREVPYYTKLFDSLGLKPGDIQDDRDLQKLPVLTKDQVRLHMDDFIARSMKGTPMSIFKTGGSTGVPVEILKDPYVVELVSACGLRAFRWTGWNIGEPVGMIWGNSPTTFTPKEKALNLLINPEIYLDTMRLTDETMGEFVRLWKEKQPTLLRGHSHSIYIFASFCAKHSITSVRPTAIISSSMMLIASERRVIEQAFQCKVTDLYGCEEVGLIGSECEVHDGMHVDMESNLLELLDSNGDQVAPGEDGAVVVTNLINNSMPLIRYKMGDVASMRTTPCKCGRTLPLMNNISGRVADFLVRKDGSVVAGVSLVERTLTKFPGVAQMQIIQENLDLVVLRIAKDPNYNESTESALIEEFKSSVGASEVRIEFVDAIPQEKSGKFRFAISKVANPYG
ncbi:MAG: phenylacetate--CoA ligase family protein [Pseudomonadota bacterium]